jgi:hypothetical protein
LFTTTHKVSSMNKAVIPSRWFSGWRTADRPMQDDPADLGTAFGLEMSLNESAREADCAQALRNGTAEETAQDQRTGRTERAERTTPARPPSLMQRLKSRRKTAD